MSRIVSASVTRVHKTGRLNARPLGRLGIAAVKGPARRVGSFFLLSLCVCMNIPSPYAVAMVTALCLKGEKALWPLCGVALGALMRVLWRIDADLWQLVGCLLAAILSLQKKDSVARAALITGAALLPRALYALFSGCTAEYVILSFFSIPLGVAAAPAFFRSAGSQSARGDGADALLCRVFPLLLLLPGAARISLLGVNFGLVATAFLSLALGGGLGVGVGMCAGLLSGLPVALSGYGAGPMICFSLSAMLAGLFKGKKRVPAACAFLLAAPVAQYAAFGALQKELLIASAVAAAAYCIAPKARVEALCQSLWKRLDRSARENAYLQAELNVLSRSLERIATALPEIEEPTLDIKDEAEHIAASLCVGCDNMAMCFRDRRSETIDLMQRLAGCGGYETVYRKIIEEGFLACPRAQNIPDIVEELTDRTFEKSRQAARAQNEREMLKTHLTAVSAHVLAIRARAADAGRSREALEEKVRGALELMHIRARVLWAQQAEGGVSIALQTDGAFGQKPPPDKLLRILENRLEAPLYYASSDERRLLICQLPPIKLLSGFASMTSAQSPADENAPPENGDAYLLREVSGGHVMIALSDGMGHGAQARRESGKTLEMLSLCLNAGYERTQAMKAVNGMMLAAAQEERYATVDLCMLDCWTGKAVLNKLGACPSLLVHGRTIQKICGETLPLGILSHVVPMEHELKMGDGDLLIMMTDGITDAFESEEALYGTLYRVIEDSPQIIADTLLYEALAAVSHRPKDDMSILCVKTVENEAARLPRGAVQDAG